MTENEDEVNATREETPLSDRRMTLIDDPVPPPGENFTKNTRQF